MISILNNFNFQYDLEPLNPVYPFLIPKAANEEINLDYQDWFKENLFKCSTQVIIAIFILFFYQLLVSRI